MSNEKNEIVALVYYNCLLGVACGRAFHSARHFASHERSELTK
jgi:hypothetical protein